MKYSKFILLIIGIVVMGILAAMRISPYITKAAFGTSPPWIINDHLLPGTTFEQIINLSRNETSQDMKVTVEIDGDKEIEKWLKIENEDNLIMKKGETILPMKVVIKVPRLAAIKEYNGGIHTTLESIPENGEPQGGSVVIKLGAYITVKLNVVGEEITDYKVKAIYVDKLNNKEDFHINLDIENLGNTEISKIEGQVVIYDKNEENILKSFTFQDLEEVVPPDTVTKTKIVYNGVHLDPGEYWVVVKAYKDGEVVYENRLYQKVNEETAITENVSVKKPGIPKLPQETEIQPETETGKEIVSAEQPEMHEAAQSNNFIVIFGIIGISFGLLSMIAIIVLLVILIRNQRQTAIQRYLTEHKLHNEK